MNPFCEIRTERLCLRRWRQEDRAPFAELNWDPKVLEFLPGPLTQEDSDAFADRIEAHFLRHGFGLWAVDIEGVTPFAGYIGLSVPRFEAHFTPCVEIGWRLASSCWNRGYATEGAKAVLKYAFTELKLPEVVSFTVPANVRSRRVMEKIGLTYSPEEDFDHPILPQGHPLRPHVLYRMANPAFVQKAE